jgi:hypothetical protein
MSIAAVTSSFIAATRELSPVVPVAVVDAVPAAGAPRGDGRRHELVDSMSRVLGLSEPQTESQAQATFRFAHALMHDLRTLAAADDRKGSGQALVWGRSEWRDLPQRIGALAAAASAAAPMASTPVEAKPPELPPQPNPLTATSAAVHLMQVPSSRLLEAYAALRQVLSTQPAEVVASAATTRSDLASFLGRLSDQLAPDAPAELPAGSVLHVTA